MNSLELNVLSSMYQVWSDEIVRSREEYHRIRDTVDVRYEVVRNRQSRRKSQALAESIQQDLDFSE